ncbi:hypothetical protein [Candidatus Poriferisocius sp.]|uniref:hypothetical protein n=1 Tax=Candidatus Poriferisocius sp. TaxID=3101276 RepID=UPI003B012EB9
MPVAPELTITLMGLLAVCCLGFSARYAVFWLKHRPLPRDYDDKGKPKPNKIEDLLLVVFAQLPLLAWALLKGGSGLNVWWLLAVALMAPFYALGKFALFRWWLPRKISR